MSLFGLPAICPGSTPTWRPTVPEHEASSKHQRHPKDSSNSCSAGGSFLAGFFHHDQRKRLRKRLLANCGAAGSGERLVADLLPAFLASTTSVWCSAARQLPSRLRHVFVAPLSLLLAQPPLHHTVMCCWFRPPFLGLSLVGLLLSSDDARGWVLLSSSHRPRRILRRPSSFPVPLFLLGREAGSPQRRSGDGRPPTFTTTRALLSSWGSLDDPTEDDGCANEEECEIDWDSMPGFAEDDNTNDASSSSSGSASASSSSPRASSSSSSRSVGGATVESSRLRLEMMWQLHDAAEDCEVDHPQTCGSQPCETCRGRGTLPCRFCKGDRILGFTRTAPTTVGAAASSGSTTEAFYACTICTHGVEACGACRGTGWVAEWTTLSHGVTTSTTK